MGLLYPKASIWNCLRRRPIQKNSLFLYIAKWALPPSGPDRSLFWFLRWFSSAIRTIQRGDQFRPRWNTPIRQVVGFLIVIFVPRGGPGCDFFPARSSLIPFAVGDFFPPTTPFAFTP